VRELAGSTLTREWLLVAVARWLAAEYDGQAGQLVMPQAVAVWLP